MQPSTGSWGLYQWFEEHGRQLIHPGDSEAFCKLIPDAKLFQCVRSEADYITLRYGDQLFRVKPDLFKAVESPHFSFGQKVLVKIGGDSLTALVSDIVWHFKDGKPFFHVCLDGRRLKRRFWAHDLSPVGEEDASN